MYRERAVTATPPAADPRRAATVMKCSLDAMEANAKPVFLLTEERQLPSVLDTPRPPSPTGAVSSSSSSHRDGDSRRDQDRDWDKDCDRDEPPR
jgi:hypothetical protein